MRVTIAPASTKTGTVAIRNLLAADETIEIRALYRNLDKVPAEFAGRPGFHAVKADVLDPSTLDFKGSDAVLAVTPPAYDGRDIVAHSTATSTNVKDAIEMSGTVKRVVLLTSTGAQFSSGVGEVKTNHIAETIFATTNVPSITFVRCGYFMENWAMGLETLKAPEPFVYSAITPLDWMIPMVAVEDIGSALASELVKKEPSPSKPYIFELHGPQPYCPSDVQAAFSKALGKHVTMKAVEKSELGDFFSQMFPPETVKEWVEMFSSLLPGGCMAPDRINYDEIKVVRGITPLDKTIKEVAQRALQLG
ncbi:hypothetical protein HIM_02069 [Hirsutella minnesotensis 3608]|nr:hypothetical protein HIM_02069 [Hirsutella minnesotensis 3608]